VEVSFYLSSLRIKQNETSSGPLFRRNAISRVIFYPAYPELMQKENNCSPSGLPLGASSAVEEGEAKAGNNQKDRSVEREKGSHVLFGKA
jgi:hypothetical protein